jgi:CHC2 zinc finger
MPIYAERKPKLDWVDVRQRVSLTAIATALLGDPPKRSNGRSWWRCPFHDDRNPSFCVQDGRTNWKCYACGEHGDAAALVMRLEKLTFPEAVKRLAGNAGIVPSSRPHTKPTSKPPERPSGLAVADALELVRDASERLWRPEGKSALDYLHARGLNDGTIRAARLGWTSGVSISIQDGARFWEVSGIVIPWLDHDRLAMVKIRRLGDVELRYIEAFRDRPSLYAPSGIVPGRALVIVEGELDSLLMGQELWGWASVATVGPASVRPNSRALMATLTAPKLFIATDADEAGDRAAAASPTWAQRVRPRAPHKDWGELHRTGWNMIRHDWHRKFVEPRPWDELSQERWGTVQ